MDIINIIQEHITLAVLYQIYSLCVGFDVLTGVVKAWKNGRLKSRTMRDGLFSSFGELILLAMCIIGTALIPFISMFVYVILTCMLFKELSSILENLIIIGVKVPKWLIKGLAIYNDRLEGDE